jgi:SlyX protein
MGWGSVAARRREPGRRQCSDGDVGGRSRRAQTSRAAGADANAPSLASNTPMDTPHAVEQRLIDLEIKASYTEDTLDRLNDVLVRQQRQIDLLLRELAVLKHYGNSGDIPAARSLRDELPPHF